MKFICLGYYDEEKFKSLSDVEQTQLMDACIAYDEELKKFGNWLGGEALQGPNSAATLRWTEGKVAITDGPYAETKEHIGGVLYLEAVDLNHAIQIMSKHPGVKIGPFEIRPLADLQEIVQESHQRRSVKKSTR